MLLNRVYYMLLFHRVFLMLECRFLIYELVSGFFEATSWVSKEEKLNMEMKRVFHHPVNP